MVITKYWDKFNNGRSSVANNPYPIPSESDLPFVENFFRKDYEDFNIECQVCCWVPGRATIHILWDIISNSTWYKNNRNNLVDIFKTKEKIMKVILNEGREKYPDFVELFINTNRYKVYNWLSLLFWEYAVANNLCSYSDLNEEIASIVDYESVISDAVLEANAFYMQGVTTTVNNLLNLIKSNRIQSSDSDETQLLYDILEYLPESVTNTIDYPKLAAEYLQTELRDLIEFEGYVSEIVDLSDYEFQKRYDSLYSISENCWEDGIEQNKLALQNADVTFNCTETPINVMIVMQLFRLMLWLSSRQSLYFDEYLELKQI